VGKYDLSSAAELVDKLAGISFSTDSKPRLATGAVQTYGLVYVLEPSESVTGRNLQIDPITILSYGKRVTVEVSRKVYVL
jgi:hypothetical protein